MDEATARALAAVNRRFYRERAADWSARREAPWPGWQRLWEIVRAQDPAAAQTLAVLDVGCGNARFGRFLAERVPRLRYTGLDASPELLAIAAARGELGQAPELRALDLLERSPAAALAGRRFDLITLFGVVHHVPGAARRRALLAGCLALLRPRGLLCATWWQLEAFARFRRRLLPWPEYNRTAPRPIDPAALEPGDHLLPWEQGPHVRYVHYADDAEQAALVADLAADPGAEVVAEFESDGREGRLNRYRVLRPAPARLQSRPARARPRPRPARAPWKRPRG
jgi:SAM-dependent methyltransferase